MNLTISAYSTALFSTWIFIDELSLLFDCGDGISATLLQKAKKIKYAFISHSDRDHIAGLLQFSQLNARDSFPTIFYPESGTEFNEVKTFSEKFDAHTKGTIWQSFKDQEEIAIKKNCFVKAIKNNHLPCAENEIKSAGFKVFESKRKLKNEFINYNAEAIKNEIAQNGKDSIVEIVNTNILSYSGDTLVEDFNLFDNCKVLIHEATFLGDSDEIKDKTKAYKHSRLEEVIKMVANINLEVLILSHFSTRYSIEEIDEHILLLCKKHEIKIPVYRIAPGKFHKNIFVNDKPVNQAFL